MVNHFVFAVYLEDKCVVDLLLPKNLYVDSCSHNNEHQHKRENVSFNTRIQLLPSVLFSADLRQNQEENEKDNQDKSSAHEESHNRGIGGSDFVVLGIQDPARLLLASFVKHVCIKDQNTFSEHLDVPAALASVFFDKFFLVDNVDEFKSEGVVFDHKKVLHKLLQNFLEGKFIDLVVGL